MALLPDDQRRSAMRLLRRSERDPDFGERLSDDELESAIALIQALGEDAETRLALLTPKPLSA